MPFKARGSGNYASPCILSDSTCLGSWFLSMHGTNRQLDVVHHVIWPLSGASLIIICIKPTLKSSLQLRPMKHCCLRSFYNRFCPGVRSLNKTVSDVFTTWLLHLCIFSSTKT